MEVKPGYKQTEVGVIPEEWTTSSITQASEMTTVGFVGSMSYLFTRSGVPVLRGQDVLPNRLDPTDTKFISPETHNVWKKSALKGGDVVMVRVGAGAGTACVIPSNLGEANAASIVVIRPTVPKLDANFLSTVINSDFGKRQVNSLLVGGAQPVINTATVAAFRIPLPPPPEQRAIATALSDVDGLLGGLDRLIAKKRDLKQAAMQQLLTGQTRLPGFRDEWEVKRLGDVAEIVMGQSPSSSNYNTAGVGLPLIQGNADIDNRKTIKRIFTTQITKRGKSGDILMSVRAPVGEVSRALFDVCLGRGVCAIRYDNDFMYHCLIYLEPTWAKHSKGSTFDSVNSADVRALEIHMPATLPEQTAVAEVLTDMDAELAALEQRREKTRALKQAMMQELLTGRTRLV